MRNKRFIVPVLFAFAFCTVALPAADKDKSKGKSKGHEQSVAKQENQQMRFRALDRNQDGTISRSEWRGNDRSFANEDWNGDGVLSGEEVRPGARRPYEILGDRGTRRFGELDRNRDGVITRDEWGSDRRAFDRLDANRDGRLSRDEVARGDTRGGTFSNTGTITCSSNDGQRVHCNADTRGGVRLVRQISGSACNQGSTWGYDSRSVWVDRGCRADFELIGSGSGVERRTIGSGTSISVRTNESIDVRNSDGRVFGSVVNQDVMDANGNVAIPKGSNAELIVRNGSGQDLALDLESVTVNGQRYAVTANAQGATEGRRDGIGTNKRTAGYVGGGALLGTIIGAVAGGGKGAAIGAAAGAAAGAGAQVMTRGKAVNVPVESLLTFRLEQPLEMGTSDGGFDRNGRHYHR